MAMVNEIFKKSYKPNIGNILVSAMKFMNESFIGIGYTFQRNV